MTTEDDDPPCTCHFEDVLGPGYPLLKVNEDLGCRVCVEPDPQRADPTPCPCGVWELGCPTEESCRAE